MAKMYPNSIFKIATQLISICTKKGIRIATAESCTGGLIAGSLTAISGSSTVFERGFNTYSNESKSELLNISLHDILKFGAVSQEIVCQMAEGVLSNSPVHLTSAVTGIAGPNGGSPEKPVGTVYIASACVSQKTLCKMFLFNGDRNKIRLETVEAALSMMLRHVVE
jgi:nicotinamide-nucleotide amidase